MNTELQSYQKAATPQFANFQPHQTHARTVPTFQHRADGPQVKNAPPKSFSKSNNSQYHYYAVAQGRVKGIYLDWPTCRAQVDLYPEPIYKGFQTADEAAQWLQTIQGRQEYIESVLQDGRLAALMTTKDKKAYILYGTLKEAFLQAQSKIQEEDLRKVELIKTEVDPTQPRKVTVTMTCENLTLEDIERLFTKFKI